MAPIVTVGSTAEDWERLDQLRGRQDTDGFLLRSTSSLNRVPRPESGAAPTVRLLLPEVRMVWNSELPFSMNESSLWAGRGANVRTVAGATIEYGPVSIVIAPQVSYQQNRDFQTFPNHLPDRSPFAHPWHTLPESLDLPPRFGDEPFWTIDLGQSSATLRLGPVATGVGTEDQWWGPGVRNALLMSNNAPGIPHAFIRTAEPVRTRIGDFEARWIVGGLHESEYFDTVSTNNLRSLAGIAGTYRPVWEPGLTVGLARTVYEPASGTPQALSRWYRVFADVGRPNARSIREHGRDPGPDQLLSVFARWVFPQDGFEVYGEWARSESAGSWRDLMVSPHHSQAYTVGLQWLRPLPRETALRLQGEATYLEMSSSFRQRRVVGFYKSRPVPQGYTHRGQIVGAAIGTGGSSQWTAADLLMGATQIGLVGGRIRWENDAYYFVGRHLGPLGHDVSLLWGLKAAHRLGPTVIAAEWLEHHRYNYLFQNQSQGFLEIDAIDVRTRTVRLSVSAAPPRR